MSDDKTPGWTCAAKRQRTAFGNTIVDLTSLQGPQGIQGHDPADCDWPLCNCDPYAKKVLAALQESGLLVNRAPQKPPENYRVVLDLPHDLTLPAGQYVVPLAGERTITLPSGRPYAVLIEVSAKIERVE